jgi:hypothetical protein
MSVAMGHTIGHKKEGELQSTYPGYCFRHCLLEENPISTIKKQKQAPSDTENTEQVGLVLPYLPNVECVNQTKLII